jgi:uncharacterized protein (TIGR02266 family)
MFLSNYVTNISKGGMFVQTDTPLPIQAEVALSLELSHPEATLEIKGRVVWTYDIRKQDARLVPGMGIKFVDLSGKDRALLEQYLSQLPCESGGE